MRFGNMQFTILFALVSELNFTIHFDINEDSYDLFMFNGNHSLAHLFISNNTLNLVCNDNLNYVHKVSNVSRDGVLTFSWPDNAIMAGQ